MVSKIKGEFQYFKSMPHGMRVLLITNMIYSMVLPIIEVFVSAYIMRSESNPSLVLKYQLAVFTGIPITFVVNGYLLNHIKVAHLYSVGMLLSGVSMFIMMFLENLNLTAIVVSGFLMGLSYGFFWANRDFLALATTNDDNRNYYYGLETFFYTISAIIIPAFVGLLFFYTDEFNWFGGGQIVSYRLLTVLVFALTITSTVIIHRGKFEKPKLKKFIYFKFDQLWNKLLVLSALKGLAQGYLVTVPAILILKLVGDEEILSTVVSISGVIAAITLYLLGRFTKPNHRIYIFAIAYIIFFIGAFTHAYLFSALGVIIFILSKVLYQPLHDISYFPIQLRVIDILTVKEGKSEFSYILNHEFGLYFGRVIGIGLFLLLAVYISDTVALRYSLIIIGIVQLLSIPLAKHIINKSK
ncbi:MFS transporter [Winogradskyella sediminis]|uniref:MFS transporter, YQGE family, putative transporter n=1 Tax=Winogradskyella sediminis TaxID=1382466 RepID=A0A1H1Q2W6_9FLAO|nr:MFS transporter [Winogradskyella sediminis]REG89891.1 YQGE family putative transporter [Winogradskyella sediminis]SDS17832.1 MFS transporter, YQGE family, putative transporter [Winogradskyella sediminis]